jgi:hypothetical protein
MERVFVEETWAGEPIVEVGLVAAVDEAECHVADSVTQTVRENSEAGIVTR